MEKQCSHGVPFFATPSPRCPRCDLEWERGRLRDAMESVERHTAKIKMLEREIEGG